MRNTRSGSGRARAAIARTGVLVLAGVIVFPTPALAALSAETGYVLTSLSLLVHGFLVFWMAAGFAMLEAGRVRTKSVSTILLKNITIVSIACIAFYLLGYNLMFYGVDGGLWGLPKPWSPDDAAALSGIFEGRHASAAHWFFQMVFVATAASIISGTLAERVKLWPFFAFVFVLAAIIYPVQGAWHWGGGWLSEIGFVDFAGATIVHSVGGWAALTGVLVLGARRGKYDADGVPQKMNASSLPLATLGTFILWLGWLGFNGGSLAHLSSAEDAIRLAGTYANTMLAAASGLVASVILSQILYKRIDVAIVLNAALGGLVSITACADTAIAWQAILVGGAGGVLVLISTPLLDRFKIDDVVGAIPVHLVAGAWGTMAAGFVDPDGNVLVQLIGIVSIGLFTAGASVLVWLTIRSTVGLRLSKGEEMLGLDRVELGTPAYPEFRLNE